MQQQEMFSALLLLLAATLVWHVDCHRTWRRQDSGYDPDRDEELTLPRTNDEIAYQVLELGATIDPITNQTRYDGFQVLRAQPTTQEHLQAIKFLENESLCDIWSDVPRNVSMVGNVDFMVSPKNLKTVEEFLQSNGIVYEVVLKDVEAEIERQRADDGELEPTSRSRAQCLQNSGMSFDSYKAFKHMITYMECLADTYPDKVEMLEIGESFEGRPLVVMRVIGEQAVGGLNERRKAMWFDANIHSREWITSHAALYLLNQLVENSGHAINREILKDFDYYIMPMANPDGYEYSRTRDRLWRKTRSRPSDGRRCVGVDPNRNWSYHWGGLGASSRRCSDTYRGPNAFSEKNTRAMSDYILHLAGSTDLQLFMSVHSYGQYIMYPWGHKKLDVEDSRDLHQVADWAAAGFKSKGNYKYKIGSAAKMLYEASGGSDDWARGAAKIKYSYTLELPDTGLFGFLLPPGQIKPVGESFHVAFYRMTQKMRQMQHTFNPQRPRKRSFFKRRKRDSSSARSKSKYDD